METKLMRILAIREKHPDLLGFTANQRYVLGRLRTGVKLKDWRKMTEFLKLSDVETGTMDGTFKAPVMKREKRRVMETEPVMDVMERKMEAWMGWYSFETEQDSMDERTVIKL